MEFLRDGVTFVERVTFIIKLKYERAMKKTSIYDFIRHPSNPFTNSFAEKLLTDTRRRETRFVRKAGSTVTDKNGEIVKEGDLLLGYQKAVDNEQFVKVYVGALMMFHNLTKKGALLFTMVLKLVQKDALKVYLVPAEMTKLMKCSDSTYYRALVELLRSEMLARSDSSSIIYYINPAFVFNGNRITILHSYVRDRSSQPDPRKTPEDIDKNDFMLLPHKEFESEQLLRDGEAALREGRKEVSNVDEGSGSD